MKDNNAPNINSKFLLTTSFIKEGPILKMVLEIDPSIDNDRVEYILSTIRDIINRVKNESK